MFAVTDVFVGRPRISLAKKSELFAGAGVDCVFALAAVADDDSLDCAGVVGCGFGSFDFAAFDCVAADDDACVVRAMIGATCGEQAVSASTAKTIKMCNDFSQVRFCCITISLENVEQVSDLFSKLETCATKLARHVWLEWNESLA